MSLFAVIATRRMALLSLGLDARHCEADRFQFRHQAILRAREFDQRRRVHPRPLRIVPVNRKHKSWPPKSKTGKVRADLTF